MALPRRFQEAEGIPTNQTEVTCVPCDVTRGRPSELIGQEKDGVFFILSSETDDDRQTFQNIFFIICCCLYATYMSRLYE